MSKLQHVHYLDSNKLDLAIFSDPISIYYLTGYLSDPHERHMLLFVMPDHESLLFLPALDVGVQLPQLIFQSLDIWIQKIHGKSSKINFLKSISQRLVLNLTI